MGKVTRTNLSEGNKAEIYLLSNSFSPHTIATKFRVSVGRVNQIIGAYQGVQLEKDRELRRGMSKCCKAAVITYKDANWNETLPVKEIRVCMRCGSEDLNQILFYFDKPVTQVEKYVNRNNG